MTQPDGVHRRRAMRLDVQRSREALKVVGPILDGMGLVQRRAAMLVAIGERRARDVPDDATLEEALRIIQTIEDRRAKLDTVLASASLVAGHSRVKDALRTLDAAAITASRARFLLANRPRE
jgi:hypothetical protein